MPKMGGVDVGDIVKVVDDLINCNPNRPKMTPDEVDQKLKELEREYNQ